MRALLTDRFVASRRPPPKGQAEFFDTKVPGLSLRVSQGGSRAWSMLYSRAGRRVRIRLGAYPTMQLAAARTAALEAKSVIEEGGDPRAGAGGTLGELVESYLARHVRPNLRGAQMVEQRFHRAVIPVIGQVPLAALHRRDINRVIDALIARGTPIEANRTFSELRACLRWAVRRGDLDHDPMAAMAMPAPPRSRSRVLDEREIAALWAALPVAFASSPETQWIIRLCLTLGQRVGEISGITLGELDLRAREWRIPADRAKNKTPHTVYLSDMALGEIESAIAEADGRANIFQITPAHVAQKIVQAREKIGLPHWSAHDCRRTVATMMAKLGIEPIVIANVLNHKSATKAGVTMGIYVRHGYQAEQRRALDLWADRLAAIVGGEPAAKIIPMAAR